MEKTVSICGIECRLKTSAALPRIYRKLFNRDIFADIGRLAALNDPETDAEAMNAACDVIENLAFAMHRHGDPAQPADICAWLEQFPDPGAVLNISDVLVELWIGETEQTSEPEKKTGPSTEE